MVAEAEKAFGAVDILVNNAGIQHVAPVDEFPLEKWDQIIAINLSSAFHATRAALPKMKAKGWGRIINTASAHAFVASPFKSAYVAAKHGIAGFTKTVALEVATQGITVNAIAPGYVWTPLVEKQIPDTMKARGLTKEQVINDVLLDGPADQGIRHRRAGRGARRLPVHRRGEVDHRHDPADGWRLDRRVTGRRKARSEPVEGLAGPKAEKTRLARAPGRRRAWRLHLGRARRDPRGRPPRHRGAVRHQRRRDERGRAQRGLDRGRHRRGPRRARDLLAARSASTANMAARSVR